MHFLQEVSFKLKVPSVQLLKQMSKIRDTELKIYRSDFDIST